MVKTKKSSEAEPKGKSKQAGIDFDPLSSVLRSDAKLALYLIKFQH